MESKKKTNVTKGTYCCAFEGCETRPGFNYNNLNPLYCFKHKLDNMISVISEKCQYENCLTLPIYNYAGNPKGIYCSKHKLHNMINIKDRRCIIDNCNTVANFNYRDMKADFCSAHKSPDMINVRIRRTCAYSECKNKPTHNYENMDKGLYCNEHKLVNMVNVIEKVCVIEGCKELPVCNIMGSTKPLYCLDHRKDDMINIVTRLCAFPECKTRPNFNYAGSEKGMFCLKHKKDNMIDIVSKLCVYPVCKTRCNFNYAGSETPLYCFKHKENNMINITENKCKHPGCLTRARYNYRDEKKVLYCEAHKLCNMINLTTKRCKTYLCDISVTNKYEGYCFNCFINTFPDNKIIKNYKTKERAVADFVLEHFNNFTWIVDKKVADGCSARRPDLLLDLGYQVIIVEIDENQHNSYDCSCENKRLMQLSQDVNHRPIVFIRFNPDEYINKDNEKIKSCWSINSNGICIVSKKNMKEWNHRLNVLKEEILYWSDYNNRTEKTIEVIQLFYNEGT